MVYWSFVSGFHFSDPGWDRRARDQNLSAAWRRLRRGRGVQGADKSPEGEGGAHSWCQLLKGYVRHLFWCSDGYHSLPIHPFFLSDTILYLCMCFCLTLSDPFCFPHLFPSDCFSLTFILWPLSSFPRRAFPLLWSAPISWLRWRGRRSVVVSIPGEWLRWRTLSTMTSSNYAPCLCE